jgi:hypothetical protein
MNQRDFLSHNQVVSLIKAVGDKRTVLIMGENGIGKTSVHRTFSAQILTSLPTSKSHPSTARSCPMARCSCPTLIVSVACPVSYPTSAWVSL